MAGLLLISAVVLPSAHTGPEPVGSGPLAAAFQGEERTGIPGTVGLAAAGGPSPDAFGYMFPYANHTGTIDYVAAGAAMRNQGYGTITVQWTGTLVAAYLVWGYMADSQPTSATLNGVKITGTIVASSFENPCWTSVIYTLVADVTAIVVSGTNTLTEFPSDISSGDDPWSTPWIPPLLEGASLVVVFDSGGPWREVDLYLGADTITIWPPTLNETFPHGVVRSASAKTTFIVSDGQYADNQALWNGIVVDTDAFPGADPRATTKAWTYGNLWDTRTYAVTVAPGSVSENASIPQGDDCLTWHGQVLRVDANHPPVLSWTGEPGYVSDGLDPESGTPATTFSYRVAYADADGDPPSEVEVRIEEPAGWAWGVFQMTLVGWRGPPGDYAEGALFAFDTTLPAGTDFGYCFLASDGWDPATGPPTACVDAPDVIDAPPTAVAWASPTVAHLGDAIAFDGSASTDDFGIVRYLWAFGDGAEDANPVTVHAYGSRGTFAAVLTVWDASDQTDADVVSIAIENRPPVADAGPDRTAAKNVSVTLDGAGSSDPDGDALGFAWTQVAGRSVALLGEGTATPTFTPPASGTYAFLLTVWDGWGGSATDTVAVNATNRAPVADAGTDRTAPKKAPAMIDGSASSDPDGDALSFAWAQIGGPAVVLAGADTATPSFTPPTSGVYTFRLFVDDGDGGTASDVVQVTATNREPTADAGADATARKRTPVTLDGSRSADPDGDALAYSWTQLGGPPATFAGADTAAPTFTPAAVGTYAFRLRVDDGDAGVAEDEVAIAVWGLPPAADLVATPRVARVGEPFALDGGRSSDADGAIVEFAFVFGDGTTAVGSDPVRDHAYGAPGTYTVVLMVTDDDGNTSTARTTVEVVGPPASVTVNWKPWVAAFFAAALLAVGAWSSKRRPWRGREDRGAVFAAFAITCLPFVLAEVGTGLTSYFTGMLSIPPILGIGSLVDGTILAAGVAITVVRLRRARAEV